MEQGFGHPTSQSDELAEQADSLEAWADELDAGYTLTRPDDVEDPGPEPDDVDEAWDDWFMASQQWDSYQEELEAWAGEATEQLEELLNNSPF